jgi:hypothetical protein
LESLAIEVEVAVLAKAVVFAKRFPLAVEKESMPVVLDSSAYPFVCPLVAPALQPDLDRHSNQRLLMGQLPTESNPAAVLLELVQRRLEPSQMFQVPDLVVENLGP